MKIEVTTKPSDIDLKIISQGIQQYNQHYLSDDVVFEADTKFAVLARNDNNDVVGGIRANAFWNYCIIELLWLSEEIRGSGVGSKLVAQAEQFAKASGFKYVRTETLSFQAKPFYEKQGYHVYGQLDDYPKGHTTFCLVKKL